MAFFPGTSYSPHQLRPLLRALMGQGERVIGWGPVQIRDDVLSSIDQIGLALTPGIGFLLSSLAGRQQRRFVIVSDRRVYVILGSVQGADAQGGGVTLNAALGDVQVEQIESQRFYRITNADLRLEAMVELIDPSRGSHRRLAEALDLLAWEQQRDARAEDQAQP